MNQKTFVKRLRLGGYAFALIVVVVFGLRYDSQVLPDEGCSPLDGLEPGDRLVLDLWVRTPPPGQAVIFRGRSADELLLGRVQAPPTNLSTEQAAAVAQGALWILIDREQCPGLDSRELGPIPLDHVLGRVAFTVPF